MEGTAALGYGKDLGLKFDALARASSELSIPHQQKYIGDVELHER